MNKVMLRLTEREARAFTRQLIAAGLSGIIFQDGKPVGVVIDTKAAARLNSLEEEASAWRELALAHSAFDDRWNNTDWNNDAEYRAEYRKLLKRRDALLKAASPPPAQP